MNILKKFVGALGYELNKVDKYQRIAVELDNDEVELIKYVLDSGYTMTTVPRLVNTLKSCKYVVENDISGDFVECGVWRGGNGILAKKLFERMGSDKKVWMFDTFEGMTAPTQFDVVASNKSLAEVKYKKTKKDTHSEWAYASLEDVKRNCESSAVNLSSIKFVKGDVCKTLAKKSNLPKEISILRLDTDWYESTKAELESLYPILSKRGVLIVDDYGYWEGSRKAVDEYFEKRQYKPLFNVVDYTGRSAIKV